MRTAMAEAGLQFPEDRVYRTTYGGTHAAEITQKLLDTGKLRPGSALVCVSDYLAVCASKMLLRNGFRIPDDFAVAGINGLCHGSGLHSAHYLVRIPAGRSGADFGPAAPRMAEEKTAPRFS